MSRIKFEEFEELFFKFGDICKHIGRIETDGKKDNIKKYDQLCREKDVAVKEFSELVGYFKKSVQQDI